MNIGFIGLGIMGKPMAKNLLKAGYKLTVFDINEKAVEEVVQAGAVSAKNNAAVAAQSDVVITVLPNSPQVEEAVLGKNGVIEGVKTGTILIDMSSIAPLISQKISQVLESRGIEMLDAPVSGGEPKAVDGTLAIMVGGKETVFNKVKDILSKIGTSLTYIGSIGSGNIAKLANQIMVAANIAGMSEALVLATKAGVNPETIFQAVRKGLAGSTVLEAKAPMVVEGNFKPGFRIELHIKDLQNALDTAQSLAVPVPLSTSIIEMMKELGKEGKSGDDHGGLIQYYEKYAQIKARKPKA